MMLRPPRARPHPGSLWAYRTRVPKRGCNLVIQFMKWPDYNTYRTRERHRDEPTNYKASFDVTCPVYTSECLEGEASPHTACPKATFLGSAEVSMRSKKSLIFFVAPVAVFVGLLIATTPVSAASKERILYHFFCRGT